MQKVNEIFGFLSPKQLTTLDNKTLREEAATTLANLYPHDPEKDELAVEIESFKYSVIDVSRMYKRKLRTCKYMDSSPEPLETCGQFVRKEN
ncbi:hypothetical protein AVEN_181125-1 [Araneus ventricosus]|uniref:Uncharacterized protein n=1 Tax=Araneus ventricosus TaxID=182803 RepID=A0A4Y2HL45_ARAVE|nr:hypothetical protein AVEN_181125-1 [Araneus ventricosus]